MELSQQLETALKSFLFPVNVSHEVCKYFRNELAMAINYEVFQSERIVLTASTLHVDRGEGDETLATMHGGL